MSITASEIGRRIKLIRQALLDMNQAKLAEKLNTKQVLISRLEQGRGSITLFLDFVNYLNEEGYKGYMLFSEPFSLDLLTNNTSINIQQSIELLKLHLKQSEKSLEDVILRLQLL